MLHNFQKAICMPYITFKYFKYMYVSNVLSVSNIYSSKNMHTSFKYYFKKINVKFTYSKKKMYSLTYVYVPILFVLYELLYIVLDFGH